MSMLLEFSMFPIGQGDSVGDSVARSLEIIDRSGVPYRLNPMGTVLEGEWDQLMGVVRQCFERMSADCSRVSCTLKFDWRRDATGRITGKVAGVERRLGRQLKQ
ncbi:MAG TPA: MTH1187 family thiamine-binding protein [Phycisphaerae bacterium]|nr:MTH1187 family thiamine-binding protein [Phycisphaerae bacterium]